MHAPHQTQVNVEHPGQVIADLYRLEAQLGRGAMGRIWRAEHLRLRSKVAIKFLDASVSGHPEAFERFVREAQSAAAVRSAHVVQIFDCGIDNGIPYISMELLEGESLDQRLSARGSLSAAELNEIFVGVAQAVDTAHELGVVHRDLKPGNIFITRERELEIAKVLDFGIAKLMNRTSDAAAAAGTGTGVMLGTPYYMSPEQVRGSRDLDQRTDLWSLAVIAFECLTGELPFRGDSVGDIIVQICTADPVLPSAVADVPPGFDEWFSMGTSKDPAARFATARQMAESLAVILARAPARADSGGRAPGDRQPTTVLPPPAPLAPSQSTGPMTASIPLASGRAEADRQARAKRRSVGVATAIALSCAVSAAVLWALPPRRVSSGLEHVSPRPASPSSAATVEASAPPPRERVMSDAPSARGDTAPPSSGAVAPEPAPAMKKLTSAPPGSTEPGSPEPGSTEPGSTEPGSTERSGDETASDERPEPSTAARAQRGTSTRAGKRAPRGRKPVAKKSKRPRAPTPAHPEPQSDPDPFSDRQ